MKNLLDIYKKELKQLYHAGKNSLNKSLFKPIALSLARIHYRLNDSYADLSEKVLQVLWPSIFQYIPSIGMVCFKGASGITIQQGSLLKGNHCYFKTVYSVTFLSITIKTIEFLNGKNNLSLLKICCRIDDEAKPHGWSKGKLRFYINMDLKAACILYELLFNRMSHISIKVQGANKIYSASSQSITSVGLSLQEFLLFELEEFLPAQQLLYDFFIYPEKFLFFDLDLSAFEISLPLKLDHFDIIFNFTQSNTSLGNRINSKSLKLNCTPIINLFDHVSQYIKFNHKHIEYKVIPYTIDGCNTLEIYDVKEVWKINTSGDKSKMPSCNEIGPTGRTENFCWSVKRTLLDKASSEEVLLNFSGYDSTQDIEILYIQAKLLCSNQNIKTNLSNMHFELITDSCSVEKIELLNGFSSPYLPREIEDKWSLVAFLSTAMSEMLNAKHQLTLLKQIIKLSPIKNEDKRKMLLNSMLSFNVTQGSQRVFKKNIAYYAQGLKISMIFDEREVSWPEFFLFWQVLKSFFSINYSLYSPISFSLVGKPSMKSVSCTFYPKL